jgi:hypothetical protein
MEWFVSTCSVNVVSWVAYQINEPRPVISCIELAFHATQNCRVRRRLAGEKLRGLVLRRRVCGLNLRVSALSGTVQGWGISGQQNGTDSSAPSQLQTVGVCCVLDMEKTPVLLHACDLGLLSVTGSNERRG